MYQTFPQRLLWGKRREEGGGIKEGRRERMESQSVLDLLGVGSGERSHGKQKEIKTGTWSKPVEGRGVSHLSKAGTR